MLILRSIFWYFVFLLLGQDAGAFFPITATGQETINTIQNFLAQAPNSQYALIFFDIDQTLLRFHSDSPSVENMISNIKKTRPDAEQLVSIWRQSRKSYLSDTHWPKIISDLKKSNLVYALTAVEAGPYGIIASMENLRYVDLKQKNLTFSEAERLNSITLTHRSGFYRGIIFSGQNSKADVLQIFLNLRNFLNRPIILIDDKLQNLEDVGSLCRMLQVPFLGIWYLGVKQSNISDDPKTEQQVTQLQFNNLINNNQWLESDDALKLIQSNSAILP